MNDDQPTIKRVKRDYLQGKEKYSELLQEQRYQLFVRWLIEHNRLVDDGAILDPYFFESSSDPTPTLE